MRRRHLTDRSRLAIIGAGGHAREIANIVLDVSEMQGEIVELQFVADGERFPQRAEALGIPVRPGVDTADLKGWQIVIGIGSGSVRSHLSATHGGQWEFAQPIKHPSSVVLRGSRLGNGTVTFPHSVVSTNVLVGRHVHINTLASVSHDVTLGDFSTIGPGARITGSVTVGECAEIGAGATILPGVSIGPHARVGAGAVVLRNVEAEAVYAGVPARNVRRHF